MSPNTTPSAPMMRAIMPAPRIAGCLCGSTSSSDIAVSVTVPVSLVIETAAARGSSDRVERVDPVRVLGRDRTALELERRGDLLAAGLPHSGQDLKAFDLLHPRQPRVRLL